ncbi:MAG: bifunctional adenosylcobinamide kinase/adenosylcobinamide-phosphate guanylyltransferase [Rhodospirillaceae bacterium]|jgi:adenosylcobinamide kinase / adenosylcobinamide-phosphate guanylyltransferase|nr:bifunctional adenosylcobinamide kinase/adenosylcobinamide-phosphate guanylyltransferase [Rhodospirillaceae bacterium]
MADITLVLGGARSGKSQYAEDLILSRGGQPIYIATGEAMDLEMEDRIQTHKQRREGVGWVTVEEPMNLAGALQREARDGSHVLVDCLTLWLANLLNAERDIEAETDALRAMLASIKGEIVFVSNEIGFGIVPDNSLARAFRDHAGRLHQAIAATADHVVLVVAGIPMFVKGGDPKG